MRRKQSQCILRSQVVNERGNAFNARTSLALPGKNTNSTGIPVFVVSNCTLTPP